MLGILISHSRHLFSAKERVAARWIIVRLCIFTPIILLVFIVLPAVAPADSLAFSSSIRLVSLAAGSISLAS
jgi:hypothetical protein